MDICLKNDTITVSGVRCFDLARSCACGQAFRWSEKDGDWFGVAGNKGVEVRQENDRLTITPGTDGDIGFWLDYFDLYRDYAAIENDVRNDAVLGPCLDYAGGIHIFNQEPFETLISFIISANNNIKRITGIVERLCVLAGEKRQGYYAFPSPEMIAGLTVEQLEGIGSGYRAPYIKKTAAMVADGYDLEALRNIGTAEAKKELMRFPGVGPKVADCVLLFSLGHTDAFPMDVWMKRAMRLMYFGGSEPQKRELERQIAALGPNSGILQQYIFHYARENMPKGFK